MAERQNPKPKDKALEEMNERATPGTNEQANRPTPAGAKDPGEAHRKGYSADTRPTPPPPIRPADEGAEPNG